MAIRNTGAAYGLKSSLYPDLTKQASQCFCCLPEFSSLEHIFGDFRRHRASPGIPVDVGD